MFRFCTVLLVIAFLHPSLQDSYEDNEIDLEGGLEDVIQNFFSSKGGQELGKTLLTMGAGSNANQILDGIGAILGGGKEGNGQIDPSFLSGVLNMLTSKSGDKDNAILPWILELFAKEGGAENLMSFLPTVMSSINSFLDEAGGKNKQSGNDWISPIVDKVRMFLDIAMHSEAGRTIMSTIKQSEALKPFFDKEGNFDLEKMFVLLENHSYRKQGIELITKKIGEVGERLFDPSIRPLILMGIGTQVNQMLQSRGFPKNAAFDMENPIDSFSTIINYAVKKFLGYQIRSKQYVKPAYKYITGIYNEVQNKGYFTGKKMSSDDLSNTLADIINLEIIEPFTRVFRAYRYTKKNSKCDRYVMCLLNKDIVDKSVSLPIVKTWLTRGASLVGSWFISNHTGTPYWTFYSYIMEDKDCKKVHYESCDSFHEEEINATTKPVHTEL